MTSSFRIKETLNKDDLMFLQPAMVFLLGYVVLYCDAHNLPMVITSLREDVDGRKTKTHVQGRAVDLSVKGWTYGEISRFTRHINKKFEAAAAISASDYKPRAVIYHKIEGGVEHLHLQVRPKDAIDKDFWLSVPK